MQPLQTCAVFPKLLEYVPGAASNAPKEPNPYLDLAAEKTYFLSVLAAKERRRTGGTTEITRLIANSSERHFFEFSHHAATVHRAFVARFCETSREDVAAAMEELERFVAHDVGFTSDDSVVVEVRRELEQKFEGAKSGKS